MATLGLIVAIPLILWQAQRIHEGRDISVMTAVCIVGAMLFFVIASSPPSAPVQQQRNQTLYQ